MADKKIRFSGEDNLSPMISKLKRDSEELGRGLIRDARSYTTSGKETLSYIEDQIKAIERRSRAEKRSQLLIAEAEKQRGEISPAQYKEKISQIGIESKADEQQVILLRELIDTVKTTSKREIIEDRKGVEKQLTQSRTIEELDPKGDEIKILKETLQRQQLGDVKEQEREERDKFTGRGVAEKVAATGGIVAGSQNQFYAVASAMAFIPVIGQAAASLAQRALGSAQAYQTAAGGMTQLTGTGGFWGRGSGMQAIGMTKAEFLQFNKQVALARGGESGSLQFARDIAFLQQGTGFNQGLLLEQERFTRGGGVGAFAGTQTLVKALQQIGVVKGQETTIVDEYLPILVNIQQEQLKIAGETNNQIATNLVAGIASLDESFKNPDVLKGVLPSIIGGFRTPSTPQVEALQFRALSSLNPQASLLDLEEMRENPTLQMVGSFLNQLRQVSPNQEIFARNVKGSFAGLSTAQARKIAQGFGQEGFDLGDYSGQLGITNVRGRGIRATGELDRASANWTQKFETVGNKLTEVINEFIEQQLPEGMKELRNSIDNLTKVVTYQAVTEGGSEKPAEAGIKAAKWIKSLFED